MTKKLFIAGVAILILVFLGIFIFERRGGGGSLTLPTLTPAALQEVPLQDRPFASLTPRSDGKELALKISGLKDVTTVEYELAYLSNDLSRGVIGSIVLNGETEITRNLLLGTCSRNVCRYDEGVTSGSLTLRLRGDGGNRKFASDFFLQKGGSVLQLENGKLRLEGTLPATYFIAMSTIGLPKSFTGEILAGPYGIFKAGVKTVKSGKISFSMEGEATKAKIFSLTGAGWQEIRGSLVKTGKISAPIANFGIFIVANP